MGIHFEVLEKQVATHNTHRIVVEAQFHTIRYADKVCRVEEHLAVYLGLFNVSLHCQRALAGSLESNELLGNKSVNQAKRCTIQV